MRVVDVEVEIEDSQTRSFPRTAADADIIVSSSSKTTLELDGHTTWIKAIKESLLGQNAVPHAIQRQLSGFIGAGCPAIRSQTHFSTNERLAMGTIEFPSNNGHSWVVWGTFAGVIPIRSSW